jgi:hypothetical protein
MRRRSGWRYGALGKKVSGGHKKKAIDRERRACRRCGGLPGFLGSLQSSSRAVAGPAALEVLGDASCALRLLADKLVGCDCISDSIVLSATKANSTVK